MLADGGQTGLADVLERSRVSQLLRDPEVVIPCRRKATGVFVTQVLLFHYLACQPARGPVRRGLCARRSEQPEGHHGGWCLSFGTCAGIKVPA
jgi:hypothetical protein